MREVKKVWLHEVLRQKQLRTSDYARDMNLSPATVSGMLGGHRAVSDDTVDRTCAFYKVAPPSPIATAAKGGLPLAVTVDQHGEENVELATVRPCGGLVLRGALWQACVVRRLFIL